MNTNLIEIAAWQTAHEHFTTREAFRRWGWIPAYILRHHTQVG